ncbi:unnamed protein product [Linum trigynum]|uniref:Uncharacterized protein n=1 Tax=Linum trigynum TaxID=586398 RepID=A0AAV2CFF5_9ROSI
MSASSKTILARHDVLEIVKIHLHLKVENLMNDEGIDCTSLKICLDDNGFHPTPYKNSVLVEDFKTY